MSTVPIAKIPFILDGFLASEFPDVPIAYQGESFDPSKQDVLWMRSTCKPGRMEENEKGSEGYSRRGGVLLVDIYAPSPLVAVDAWELAERVENAFRRKCIAHIQMEDPETDNMGVDKYDKYHVRVTAPWWCWAKNK